MPKITPNLWFDTEAEEAADFYVSVFPRSRVTSVTHYTEGSPGVPGTVLTVSFELDGQEHTAINGGPQFPFTEAVSLLVNCADQDEVDHYWDRLVEGGGSHGRCGWLKDRFGLSWQVVPQGWDTLFRDGDPARVERAMRAMLAMDKLDIAALERAADGA